MHQINIRENKWTKQQKTVGEKHAYVQAGGVSNCRGRRYKGKEELQSNIIDKWQAYEWKSTGILVR